MMSAWPRTLPRPETGDYGLEPEWGVTRTEMESGPTRQRRRFTQTPTKVPAKFVFTLAEMATFEAWWELEIHQGADWFDIELMNGLGLRTCRARFTEAWKGRLVGKTIWQIKATLEIERRPILTRAELAPRL